MGLESFFTHNPAMHIRPFRPGDASALRAVFYSSVHQLARLDYSAAQLHAWAPSEYDAVQWAERLRANQPFVAEVDGAIAGFADVQPSGYIDQFFVAGDWAGRGVARTLMAQIHHTAAQARMSRLWAQVSLSAEPFFRRSGFVLEARQQVTVRGVVLANARMGKPLHAP